MDSKVKDAIERARLLKSIKESFIGANGASGLSESMQIEEDRRYINMLDTLITAAQSSTKQREVVDLLIETPEYWNIPDMYTWYCNHRDEIAAYRLDVAVEALKKCIVHMKEFNYHSAQDMAEEALAKLEAENEHLSKQA